MSEVLQPGVRLTPDGRVEVAGSVPGPGAVAHVRFTSEPVADSTSLAAVHASAKAPLLVGLGGLSFIPALLIPGDLANGSLAALVLVLNRLPSAVLDEANHQGPVLLGQGSGSSKGSVSPSLLDARFTPAEKGDPSFARLAPSELLAPFEQPPLDDGILEALFSGPDGVWASVLTGRGTLPA
jgi:hypothetical protein